MKPLTKAAAKAQGLPRFFTGKPCKQGHVAEQYVCNGACVICACEATKRCYRKDPTKAIARAVARNRANPALAREHVRRWQEKYPEKVRANFMQWWAKNPTRPVENVRKWRLANPLKKKAQFAKRKALMRGAEGELTADDIMQILVKQNGVCFYCDENISETYTIDHFVPLIHGGSHWPHNIRLSCLSCNASKGSKLPHEFVPRKKLNAVDPA